MDWFGLKASLITCLVFVPLERLVAMHPQQRMFRRGWHNDLIYVLLNAAPHPGHVACPLGRLRQH